jgi:hypothetical protein
MSCLAEDISPTSSRSRGSSSNAKNTPTQLSTKVLLSLDKIAIPLEL